MLYVFLHPSMWKTKFDKVLNTQIKKNRACVFLKHTLFRNFLDQFFREYLWTTVFWTFCTVTISKTPLDDYFLKSPVYFIW